jgi:hypothetical protein
METLRSVFNKPKSAEINPGPGLRIRLPFERLDHVFTQRFATLPSPDVSNRRNRLYAFASEIRCLSGNNHPPIGPAFTVRVYPGNNLMIHKARADWHMRRT